MSSLVVPPEVHDSLTRSPITAAQLLSSIINHIISASALTECLNRAPDSASRLPLVVTTHTKSYEYRALTALSVMARNVAHGAHQVQEALTLHVATELSIPVTETVSLIEHAARAPISRVVQLLSELNRDDALVGLFTPDIREIFYCLPYIRPTEAERARLPGKTIASMGSNGDGSQNGSHTLESLTVPVEPPSESIPAPEAAVRGDCTVLEISPSQTIPAGRPPVLLTVEPPAPLPSLQPSAAERVVVTKPDKAVALVEYVNKLLTEQVPANRVPDQLPTTSPLSGILITNLNAIPLVDAVSLLSVAQAVREGSDDPLSESARECKRGGRGITILAVKKFANLAGLSTEELITLLSTRTKDIPAEKLTSYDYEYWSRKQASWDELLKGEHIREPRASKNGALAVRDGGELVVATENITDEVATRTAGLIKNALQAVEEMDLRGALRTVGTRLDQQGARAVQYLIAVTLTDIIARHEGTLRGVSTLAVDKLGLVQNMFSPQYRHLCEEVGIAITPGFKGVIAHLKAKNQLPEVTPAVQKKIEQVAEIISKEPAGEGKSAAPSTPSVSSPAPLPALSPSGKSILTPLAVPERPAGVAGTDQTETVAPSHPSAPPSTTLATTVTAVLQPPVATIPLRAAPTSLNDADLLAGFKRPVEESHRGPEEIEKLLYRAISVRLYCDQHRAEFSTLTLDPAQRSLITASFFLVEYVRANGLIQPLATDWSRESMRELSTRVQQLKQLFPVLSSWDQEMLLRYVAKVGTDPIVAAQIQGREKKSFESVMALLSVAKFPATSPSPVPPRPAVPSPPPIAAATGSRASPAARSSVAAVASIPRPVPVAPKESFADIVSHALIEMRNYTSYVVGEGDTREEGGGSRSSGKHAFKPPALETLLQSASILLILQERGDLVAVKKRLAPPSVPQFEEIVAKLEKRIGGTIDHNLTRHNTVTLPNQAPELTPSASRILLDTILKRTIGAAITATHDSGYGHGGPLFVEDVARKLGYNTSDVLVTIATKLGWSCENGMMREARAEKKKKK